MRLCIQRQEKDKERAKNHNKKISQVKIEASESKINPNEYLHKHIYPPTTHIHIDRAVKNVYRID